MLKTRLTHRYCSRHPAASPYPYTNIREQRDNFVPDPGATDIITRQLNNIQALHTDAQARS